MTFARTFVLAAVFTSLIGLAPATFSGGVAGRRGEAPVAVARKATVPIKAPSG